MSVVVRRTYLLQLVEGAAATAAPAPAPAAPAGADSADVAGRLRVRGHDGVEHLEFSLQLPSITVHHI